MDLDEGVSSVGATSSTRLDSTLLRWLVVLEAGVLLAPATVLTVFALAFAIRSVDDSPASWLIVANGLLALLALGAAWFAIGVHRVHGSVGLARLNPRVVFAMATGLVLVGLGALALSVRALAPINTGELALNLLGLPAAVPCAHLLWLRDRAIRASSGTAPPRRFVAALAGVALGLVALQWATSGPLPFNGARWRALANDDGDPWFRRRRMVDWLVLEDAFAGRTRAEVVALLGEPNSDTGTELGYELGDTRGVDAMGIDVLRLTLDAKGHVSSTAIYNSGD